MATKLEMHAAEPCPSRRRWIPWADVMKLLRENKPDPRFFEDVAELGAVDDLEEIQEGSRR